MPIDPVTGAALITGGASLIGGLFGRSSAKKSISFQREMATTAHQKEVRDLRLAGLNPILSGTGGPGAKASGGAMPPTPDFAASARMAMRIAAEVKLLNQQARGAGFKADIDAPAAMVGRLAAEAAGKVEKGARATKYVFPTGQQAIPIADERRAENRIPFRGFNRRTISKAERLREKARRARSRRR